MIESRSAFIGLGGNLDDPMAQVLGGIDALSRLPDTGLVSRSQLYGSAPMGPAGQPDYVNAVAWIETSLEPHGLLDALQQLEARAGRDRSGHRWGPRTLDLDLLVHGERSFRDQRLTLPHPGITERAFVLVPLAEIASGLVLPGENEAVGVLAERVDRRNIWVLEASR